MQIIYMGGHCLKKLPVNDFKWIKKEELSYINEDFIKTMMKMVI